MKIPTKVQANTQMQEIKRQQISEGSEMVAKIEALRKALNSLQEQHKHFIENSKEELIRETTELFGQKESLKAEVDSLTAVRAELQRPLDEEWKKLKDAQVTFERDKEKSTIQDDKLGAKERELKVRQAVIDITLEKAEKAQAESEKRNREAEDSKNEAETILKAIQNKKDATNKKIADRLEDLKKKEEGVEFEKQGVEQMKKLNEIKERELNEKELEINAKYRTLIATENGKPKRNKG